MPFAVVVALLVAGAVAALVLRWPAETALQGLDPTRTPPSDPEPSPSVTVTASPTPSPTTTARPLPECGYRNLRTRATAYSAWRWTLLDPAYKLPRDYTPPGLVAVSEAGFEAPFLVRQLVVEDLAALREAAEEAGHAIEVAAAYRSWDQQRALFEKRTQELGIETALRRAARPGHSEHQLGSAVDFKTKGNIDVTRRWGSTPEGRWMAENAHRFGFVLSYPQGEADRTCYGYEPWHFRYFGVRLAARIHASGLTVREFLWLARWKAAP